MASRLQSWLFFILLSLGCEVSGADSFLIKPKTCAVIESGQECQLELKIRFHLETAIQTCVWIASQSAPKKCYNKAEINDLILIRITKDTLVQIRDVDNHLIKQVMIRFAIYQPIKIRERSSLNWNLL
ncbi:MAG: DUF3019 domain-containing protein [Shewanella sp.]